MSDKVLLINEEQRCSETLKQGIHLAGYTVQKELITLRNVKDQITESTAALVLNIHAVNSEYNAFLKESNMSMALPVIVFVEVANKTEIANSIKAGIHAFIVNGLEKDRIPAIIEMAMIRFAEQQSFSKELDRVKRSLEDRKIIDRAKGVLMDMRGMKEKEAYQSLRKLAMDQNKRMVEVCNDVIEMFKYIA